MSSLFNTILTYFKNILSYLLSYLANSKDNKNINKNIYIIVANIKKTNIINIYIDNIYTMST